MASFAALTSFATSRASHIDLIRTAVSDIATMASSQAKHLDGFKATIREIDLSTQQTAAMAEESEAARQSMQSDALISQFDFGETERRQESTEVRSHQAQARLILQS
ncbi:hypothetical protein [Rhizobium mongolense]